MAIFAETVGRARDCDTIKLFETFGWSNKEDAGKARGAAKFGRFLTAALEGIRTSGGRCATFDDISLRDVFTGGVIWGVDKVPGILIMSSGCRMGGIRILED